jgi:hypothetical protein
MNRKPLKRHKVNSLGRASQWAFPGRAWERVFSSCDNCVRSPLAPLKKGGTGKFLKVPLFKGDLGGSKLRTVVRKANSRIRNCMNRKPMKRHKVNSLGSAPVPTPLNWGNHGGIAPTGLHDSLRRAI